VDCVKDFAVRASCDSGLVMDLQPCRKMSAARIPCRVARDFVGPTSGSVVCPKLQPMTVV